MKWVWKGKSLHNVKVTQRPGEVRLAAKTSGKFYASKLTQAGTYTIICTVHGATTRA